MKKYLILIICLLFASLNFNLFLKQLNLVTGGTQGLSIILNHLTKIDPSTIILFINIVSLILSFIFLKKETTTSSIISTFIYPLFIKLTSFIPNLSIIRSLPFISSLLAGTICGITGGIIYKLNFSQGGITIINLLLKKYLNIKVSISNFIINSIIILIGSIYFGITKTIYSLLVVTISSLIINLIISKNNLTINKT